MDNVVIKIESLWKQYRYGKCYFTCRGPAMISTENTIKKFRKMKPLLAERHGHAKRLPENLGARCAPIFRKYHVRKAILFGSAGRGEMTLHSDIDLILVMDTDRRFLDRYKGILFELNDAVKDPYVEPLIYTAEELDSVKNRPFISKALKEGIALYEQK